MKQQLINISKAAVLATAIFAAGTLASCSDEHEGMGGAGMEGSIPLVLGEVSVGTPATTSTRAAVAENAATGYTGIRKSRFVEGDALTLTLKNGSTPAEGTTVTASLTGGKWVLSKPTFVTAGTTLTATYAATEQSPQILADHLTASSYSITPEGKMTITMLHKHAMMDITVPAGSNVTAVAVTTADASYPTVAEEDAEGAIHHRTIVPAGAVTGFTATLDGKSYSAKVESLTAAANKRYPVNLTFKNTEMTATVSAGEDWAAGENIISGGYTRIIATAEDLAQFAKDVNDDTAGTGARVAKVIQVADIDLGTLKSSPNYTATADNWVPIGTGYNVCFKGTYNGSGHTISNLKISNGWDYAGLFGYMMNGTLVGIHLRNCALAPASFIHMGALVGFLEGGNSVSLCSATGSVTATMLGYVGGLVGAVKSSSISRCSANVDVSHKIDGPSSATGSFIGSIVTGSVIAGCLSSGNVTSASTTNAAAGFIGKCSAASIIGCCFNGSLQGADKYSAFLNLSDKTSAVKITSCYATAAGKDFVLSFDNSGSEAWSASTFTDCAWTGTTTLAGVRGGLAANGIYTVLTATVASLADVKTHHWSAANGYTADVVTATWYSSHIWKENTTGAPGIDLSYEGTPLYRDKLPNLLSVPGGTPYWVAPEDASTDVVWSADLDKLCPEGWHVPTKDEFVAMTGLPADDAYHDTNNAAIKAAFPAGILYWSSTEYELNASSAWTLYVRTDAAGVKWNGKTSSYRPRCVRAK